MQLKYKPLKFYFKVKITIYIYLINILTLKVFKTLFISLLKVK